MKHTHDYSVGCEFLCLCGAPMLEADYHGVLVGWRCRSCGRTNAYEPPRRCEVEKAYQTQAKQLRPA